MLGPGMVQIWHGAVHTHYAIHVPCSGVIVPIFLGEGVSGVIWLVPNSVHQGRGILGAKGNLSIRHW